MTKSVDAKVKFSGGKRVDAYINGHVVRTDQPESHGGENSAPSPFNTFLASLATCAGIYVLGFCQSRNLPTNDISLTQKAYFDPTTGVLSRVDIEIEVPADFPEKYRSALIRVAEQCAVKKAIAAQPELNVRMLTPA